MPELIPVIHIISEQQVFKNIEICIEAGIKKVFLIRHNNTAPDVLKMAIEAKEKYPDFWIGINLLGVPTERAIQTDYPVDGLWCDNGLTDKEEEELAFLFGQRKFKGMFFGGLEFKYQRQSNDIESTCDKAERYHDVCTTSGSATGQAPTTHKIQKLRDFLGPYKPLAIASGVSVENIDSFKHLVNYVLVATSITDIFTEVIDIDKLKALKDKLETKTTELA